MNGMILRIDHETHLDYSDDVSEHVFELRMAPSSDEDQTTLGCKIQVNPSGPSTTYLDGFGNRVELLNILGASRGVAVRATSFVRTHRRSATERMAGISAPSALAEGASHVDAMEYLQPSPMVKPCPELDALLAEFQPPLEGTLEELVTALREYVHGSLTYAKEVTSSESKLAEILKHKSGVCQDFSHLFIAVCRKFGLPARYVSGYVHQTGELATHAWCQIWANATEGWVDVDPTHNLFPGDNHVVTAVGRDYSDVPPNRGAWKGEAKETMNVLVRVEKVPRLPADWIVAETLPARNSSRSAAPVRPRPGASRMIGLAQHQRNMIRYQQQQQQQQ